MKNKYQADEHDDKMSAMKIGQKWFKACQRLKDFSVLVMYLDK